MGDARDQNHPRCFNIHTHDFRQRFEDLENSSYAQPVKHLEHLDESRKLDVGWQAQVLNLRQRLLREARLARQDR
jgi:hypothetical protein